MWKCCNLYNHSSRVMLCDFQLNADGFYQCTQCGWTAPRKLDKAPFRNCQSQEPDLTPEVERLGITPEMAKRWMVALLKWRAAGYPTRTQEEVDRIVAICVKCKHYTKGRCRKCGCCVSHSKIPIVNKARLFTEACMENKW